MKTLALYSIKGGVGKTAAAVNLAWLASKQGASTLIIDLDPQSAATYYFRIRSPKKHNQVRLVKGGKKLENQIKSTDFVLPQSGCDPGSEKTFKKASQRSIEIL